MFRLQDAVSDSKDELLSDSFDFKEVDGVVYEADCAMIEIGAVNVGTFFFYRFILPFTSHLTYQWQSVYY